MKRFPFLTVLGLLCVVPWMQAHADTRAKEERNKANAIEYWNTQNTKDWEKARTFLRDDYIEHHPMAPKGIPGIQSIERTYRALHTLHPQHRTVIYRAFAEGDLVAMHVRTIEEPGMKGTALIEILRFDENGKIAEHWHALQPVQGVLNYNSMF
jgi:predicted SnoaL-like aldol condensation-catalyzing enzyme